MSFFEFQILENNDLATRDFMFGLLVMLKSLSFIQRWRIKTTERKYSQIHYCLHMQLCLTLQRTRFYLKYLRV